MARESQLTLGLVTLQSEVAEELSQECCERAYRASQDEDWMEIMSKLLASPGHIMTRENELYLQLIDEMNAGMIKFGKNGWERVSE